MSNDLVPLRGQVIRAHIGLNEPKLFVVVSNNIRNEKLDSVLCVRLTTTRKPDIPSVVQLPPTKSLTGWVVCDDITEIFKDEIVAIVTALPPHTMRAIGLGLAAALGL